MAPTTKNWYALLSTIIISLTNEQRAKQIGTNYQPYWIKQ